MFKNYFKIALRSLAKQKFFTILNITGLSLGIAGGLVLFQFIRYHLNYDGYHRNAGQLYRVVSELHLDDGTVEYEKGTPLDLTEALQREVPEVKDQAVILKLPAFTVGVPGGGNTSFFKEQGNIGFADRHWFNLFDYRWVEGDAETSLSAPKTAVITRKLAQKYFGNDQVIGKTIRLDDKYAVTITGVLEDYPDNTDMKVDLFLSRPSFRAFFPELDSGMHASWGMIMSYTQSFLWLPDVTAGKKIESAIARIKGEHFDKGTQAVYQFHLQPVKDMHFDARFGGTMQYSLLTTLAIVGLFLVLIACFNFINLATAQSLRRAREVGTRKVLGSTTGAIFWQFMTETACIVLLATALSLVWVQLSIPLSQRWLQTRLTFDLVDDRQLLLFLVLLTGLVTVMAGFYPAMILSRWKPISALKEQVADTGSILFRRGLIVVQHVVVQALIICTIIMTLQIRYMKNADPGFNKDAVLMIPVPDPEKGKEELLRHRLLSDPGIQSVSLCYQAPLSESNVGGSVGFDNRPWENFVARTILGDSNYLPTFQLQLLAGRNLEESDTVREFLLNETLLHKFGFSDPRQVIGHQVVDGALGDHRGTVVGVVKDFNVHPLYTGLEPVLITTERGRYRYAAIKLNKGSGGRVRETIQKTWQGIYTDNVFEYHYMDEQIDAFYHKEDVVNKLINTIAVIAIIISCLGLSGLISFFAVQRTKEIGIRKVLGATVPGIVYLLSKDFLKLVAGSMLIAAPLAWFFMNGWLRNFAYRIQIGWWVFVLAGMLSAFIAVCTVSYQAVKAALANPADSLRSE